MLDADYFAYNQYRDYTIYKALAKDEKVPEFKKILEELIEHEYQDYDFWLQLSKRKKFSVSRIEIFFFKLMRNILGLTFTVKYLEGHEKVMIRKYTEFSATVDKPLQEKIGSIIEHERYHERQLIGQIKEERVEFISNIILGLNDGLIELTGALVGFSFAFANTFLVAVTGMITGLAASLSMASSAYMQARHEKGKQPVKAGFYTGLAYMVVVALLILPFWLFPTISEALIVVAVMVLVIVGSVAFYTSVLFERVFVKQFTEIALFSIGVAVVTFIIGSLIRTLIGVGS